LYMSIPTGLAIQLVFNAVAPTRSRPWMASNKSLSHAY